MKLAPSTQKRQMVFQHESALLASLDRAHAKRLMKVYDSTVIYRLWSQIHMLPTRPESGWRTATSTIARQALQNTYQTAAFAYDIGCQRSELAHLARNFKHFGILAREATRLFDLRIGPPWWVRNSSYLEMVYTAIMAQQEPADEETVSCVEGYLGDCSDLPQWEAESYLDWVHSTEADTIGMCRLHYYNDRKVKPEFDPLEAELSLLLNWQITYQPRFTIDLRDCQGSYVARTSYPHRAEERRLIRALNTQPRGRPQR